MLANDRSNSARAGEGLSPFRMTRRARWSFPKAVGHSSDSVDGRWVPTFRNARYLMGRVEFDYWKDARDPALAQIFDDSVRPVADAGLVDVRRLRVTPTGNRHDRAKRFSRCGHDPVTASPWTPVIVPGGRGHIHLHPSARAPSRVTLDQPMSAMPWSRPNCRERLRLAACELARQGSRSMAGAGRRPGRPSTVGDLSSPRTST